MQSLFLQNILYLLFCRPWSAELKYPDTLGLAYDERTKTLSAVYSDHSLYTWDLKHLPHKIFKLSSYLYHSSCVWAVSVSTMLTPNQSL